MNGVIQILAATLGSCGFAIVFQIKPKHIKFVAVGGALSWLSYLLFYALLGNPCGVDVFGGGFGDGVFRSDGPN